MLYSTAFTIAAAALLGSSMAAPAPHPDFEVRTVQRRQSPPNGQTQWTNPSGGNIKIGYADQGVQFGNIKPSSIINNNVSVTCSTIGTCVGGTGATDIGQSQYISNGDLEGEDIKYTVTGDYPVWAHNGLIETLAWAMDNQTTTSHQCYSPYATSSCDFESYCPEPQQTCFDQYTAPASVAVVFTGDLVDKDAAPPYISVNFVITQDSDSGICKSLATIGSGMAGFIGEAGGPAGGIFSLASLFCNL